MTWIDFHEKESQKPYFNELQTFVENEYKTTTCYPPFEYIFRALDMTSYEDTKCVILGQDPYHGANQAIGLSFAVSKGVTIPPSLRNIYTEINNELGCYIPNNGDLSKWARQGVLMLNAVLSVRAGSPASHAGHGWETYTDAILTELNKRPDPIVFMLWGNYARAKKALITNPQHLVLESPHPSPYSADRGFFGNGHFAACNQFLANNNKMPIDWQIENI